MGNQHARRITLFVSLILTIGMLAPGNGYSQFQPGQKRVVTEGEDLSVKGVILSRDGDTIVLRDPARTDTVVQLTDATKVRTERKWLIAGRRPFDVTVLIPGLIVTAKGKGAQGKLVADAIEFTEEDMKAAMTAYAQTAPLAKEAAESKKQLAETQQQLSTTQQQLSDTQQKLADTSKEVVDTNKRISQIDQYDIVKTVSVLFAVGSAKLSDAAKTQLDDLAANAPTAKNYLVEVQGYADATGAASKNLELSQERADAVVQYLTVKHSIPLRRITMPMGYGETKANDKAAPADRARERRVDVKVLVNKGLGQ